MFRTGFIAMAAALNLFAADPFQGVWHRVRGNFRLDPPARAVISPRPNGLTFISQNGNNTARWSADFDGRDYPVTGSEAGYEVSLRRAGADGFEVARKRNGKQIGASVYAISADRKEISVSSTYSGQQPYRYVYERTGGDSDPANPFAGRWTVNYEKRQVLPGDFTMTFTPEGDDGIHYSNSSGGSWAARFDGKEHALDRKFRGWESVMLRRIDSRTFELAGRRAWVGSEMWRFAVSADGREMTVDGSGSYSTGAEISLHEVYSRPEPWVGRWRVVSVESHYERPYRITISNQPGGLRLVPNWSATGRPVPRPLRRVDSTTAESSTGSGASVRTVRYAVSADGRVLTMSGKSTAGQPQTSVFERSGEAPVTSDAFLGVWEYNEAKSFSAVVQRPRVYELGPDGRLRFTGAGMDYVAAFDGKDHPLHAANDAMETVSLRRIDSRSFEETFKRSGEPYQVRTVTVSSGGNEMTFTHTGTFFGAAGRRVVVMRRE